MQETSCQSFDSPFSPKPPSKKRKTSESQDDGANFAGIAKQFLGQFQAETEGFTAEDRLDKKMCDWLFEHLRTLPAEERKKARQIVKTALLIEKEN